MKIVAPLSGVVCPLSEVPDPVFSQKMAGDGISIDPTSSVLLAPVSGKISFLHPAAHALTIMTESGQEVLIHIGIDTVKLKGEGFSAKVKTGQSVKAGEALISFDMDLIATRAKSLLTQILWQPTAGWKITALLPAATKVKAGQNTLFEIQTGPERSKAAIIQSSLDNHKQGPAFQIQNHNGLHARPAATLSQSAKKYSSEVLLWKGQKSANAKSPIAIMSLEIAYQDQLRVTAAGADADKAVVELTKFIQSGLGEEVAAPSAPTHTAAPTGDARNLIGIVASPGLAIGPIFQMDSKDLKVPSTLGLGYNNEKPRLEKALAQAKSEIRNLAQDDKEQAEIFAAHCELLEDPELLGQADKDMIEEKSATQAWHAAYTGVAASLAALHNELLANRAHDLIDVGERVLKILLGLPTSIDSIAENSIVVSRQLSPSQMSLLKKFKAQGLCTIEGGPSSHVAILARSMGMPALTGMPEILLGLRTGQNAILDTDNRVLIVEPSKQELQKLQDRQKQLQAKDDENLKSALHPAVTEDNHSMHVFANIGNLQEAQVAVAHGAEGVGLLRSEFLFLHRQNAPTEKEQKNIYQDILIAMQTGGKYRPVVIRTLDVGGDKPLSYLPVPPEENPFLGVRGLRLSLQQPEIFRTQLSAIMSAAEVLGQNPVHIMFPMVTSLAEVIEAKEILKQEQQKLGAPTPQIGIMIEVPSAALMAEVLAPHVDFFSIGSNDLTQYVLAIDRGHKDLAKDADGLHPAVLKTIQMTCEGAHKFGKMVGVCGGIAGDLQAVPLLIGLGVDELSVSVPAIPSVKALIRKLRKSSCQELAAAALKKTSAQEVRDLVNGVLS